MTLPMPTNLQPGTVRSLRSIREQLSHEIKDMTFEQERAYLDQLLAGKAAASNQHCPAQTEAVVSA